MKQYLVEIREVHIATIRVEAESPEDAQMCARQGLGQERSVEYSHSLDIVEVE